MAYMRTFTAWLIITDRGGVKAFTRRKPTVKPKEVCVKVNIELPSTIFEQPAIEAKISVPAESATPKVVSTVAMEKVKNLIEKDTGLPVRIELVGFEDKKTQQ